MSQPFAELSNLTGGINPLPESPHYGEPGTPVEMKKISGVFSIDYGPSTLCQLPTTSLAHAIIRSNQWVGAHVAIGITVMPATATMDADVTAGSPGEISFSLDAGQTSPPMPGPDDTLGGSSPITATWDAVTDGGFDPHDFKIGTFPPADTGGFDSLYLSPVITVSLGRDLIFTNGWAKDTTDAETGVIYYRMSGVRFSLAWRYWIDGPGVPDAIPAIPPQPLVETFGSLTAESGNFILPPCNISTLWTSEPELHEYDLTVSDSIAGTTEDHLLKIRVLGDSTNSPTEITGDAMISITHYATARPTL